jgi:hypothetical protein
MARYPHCMLCLSSKRGARQFLCRSATCCLFMIARIDGTKSNKTTSECIIEAVVDHSLFAIVIRSLTFTVHKQHCHGIRRSLRREGAQRIILQGAVEFIEDQLLQLLPSAHPPRKVRYYTFVLACK